jgi:hypothetical protein
MSITFAHVLEEANEVISVFQEVHAHVTKADTGFVDVPRRIELELNGWGSDDGAIPEYRRLQCTLRGETGGARVDTDAVLPSYHLSQGDRVVIREGLLQLRTIPGLALALQTGQNTLRQKIDQELIPLIARGLPPDSGVKIVSAWVCLPARSLYQMIKSIRTYVLSMRT